MNEQIYIVGSIEADKIMRYDHLQQIVDIALEYEDRYPQLALNICMRRSKALKFPMIEIRNRETFRVAYFFVDDLNKFKEFIQLCVDDEVFMKVENEDLK